MLAKPRKAANARKRYRKVLERVAATLNIKTTDDWYKHTSERVRGAGGYSVLRKYGSLALSLTSVIPSERWQVWKFRQVPARYWAKLSHQRDAFNILGEELNIHTYEDWYIVDIQSISTTRGKTIVGLYNGSLLAALQSIYPEYPWSLSTKLSVNRGTLEEQRQQFDVDAQKCRVMTQYDWLDVQLTDLSEGCISLIKNKYRSITQSLEAVYPYYDWAAYRLSFGAEWGTLKSIAQKREKINFMAKKVGIKDLEGWYTMNVRTFHDLGGGGMLSRFDNSLFTFLSHVYPDFDWKRWKFVYTKIGLTKSTIESIGERLGVKLFKDWYTVQVSQVQNNGGHTSLKQYQGSLSRLLQDVYPDIDWKPYSFLSAPQHYWDDMKNQRAKFEDLGQELRILVMDDWRTISHKTFIENGASSIFKKHGTNLPAVLTAIYPDYDWDFKNTSRQPYGHWVKQTNQVAFLKKVKHKLGISNPSQWYRVSSEQLQALGAGGFVIHFPHALKRLYPSKQWDWTNFVCQTKKSQQRSLKDSVNRLFPDQRVQEECNIGTCNSTGSALVIDVFVPKYNLAIEYQGEHHYDDVVKYYVIPSSVYKARDFEKRQACKAAGITLVNIPYWWKGDLETIAATIYHYKPEVKMSVSQNDLHGVTPLISTDSAPQALGQPAGSEHVRSIMSPNLMMM